MIAADLNSQSILSRMSMRVVLCFLVLKVLLMNKMSGCVSARHVVIAGLMFIFFDFFIDVVPRPKILEPPENVITIVGYKAFFTRDFEAATDNKIAQIHWLFNGNDLAGCNRFKDRINCTVTQQSTDKNYISSTLTIYPVQADNAGQYTCYCSYDTSLLNVDGVRVIESDHKSATLSVLDSGTIAIL